MAEEVILHTPVQMPRSLLGVYHHWPEETGFDQIELRVTLHNDIDFTRPHGLYLIGCSPFAIGDADAYFGLQTDVQHLGLPTGSAGKGVIFSRWYADNESLTVRLADTRIAEDGWTEAGSYEGNFVSVRSRYDWTAGDYTFKVAAQESDDVGRWYGLFVVDSEGAEMWLGSLRFTPDAKIQPYCGTVIEAYGSRPLKPSQVPYWKVTVKPPRGDLNSADLSHTWYPDNVETLRNTLISVADEGVTFEVGLDYLPNN